MSTFNVSQMTGVNLASSVAGTQKKQSTNETKAAAGNQDFNKDLKAMATKEVGDASEAETSSDRDADGRLLSGGEHHEGEETPHDANASADSKPTKTAPRSIDVNEELGTKLDLDA